MTEGPIAPSTACTWFKNASITALLTFQCWISVCCIAGNELTFLVRNLKGKSVRFTSC